MTKRKIGERYNEHLGNYKNNREGKSAIGDHMFYSRHKVDGNNLNLLKKINDQRFLNAWESLWLFLSRQSLKASQIKN